MRRLGFLVLLLLAPLAFPLGCGDASLPAETGTTNDGYAEDALCADCHADLAASYRNVGMARAFYPATAQFLAGDAAPATFFHAKSQRHYETFVRDGWLHMRRWQVDANGARRNQTEHRLDWVIGSGNHVRSYAFVTPAGEWFAAPLNWYAEGGWGMAPGYDFADHFGFARPIPRACVFCHNAYPTLPLGADRGGRRERFTAEQPHGLGCQRCHGPGQRHADLAAASADDDEVRRAIVNPARLPVAQRDDVCLQCHLQPTSRVESRQTRFGRGTFSYRSDEPLRDYLVLLEFDAAGEDGPDERFQINHHAYRLRQSRCFTASAGTLRCTTCHDPHHKPPPADAAAHHAAQCRTCHAIDVDVHARAHAAKATDTCVSCHMPKRRPADVVHAVVTDHRISRRSDVADPTGPRRETPKPKDLRPRLYGADHGLTPGEASLYLAHARVREGEIGAAAALAAALQAHPVADAEPYLTLAHAQHAGGHPDDAAATLRGILERDPACVGALVALGSLRSLRGDQSEAERLLRRALELDPQSPDAQHELAVTLHLAARPADALAHAEAATRLRPVFAVAWSTQARILLALGRRSDARAALDRAAAHDPGAADAYEALAQVQAEAGDGAGAEATLRLGIAVARAPLPLELALARTYLLGRAGDPVALRAGLQLAVDVAARHADDAGARLHVALALLLNDRAPAAAAQADAAERAGADPVSCTLIRALARAAEGDLAGARALVARVQGATVPPTSPAIRAAVEAATANALR